MSQHNRENPDAPIPHDWLEGVQHVGFDPGSGKDFSAVQNNDRELWRETSGDFYADSIHVTMGGNIGIQVGGHVLVMPLKRWFEAGLAAQDETPATPVPADGEIDMLTDRLANFVDNAIRKGTCSTYSDWQEQIHALLTSRR